MNDAKYHIKTDTFIMKLDEEFQISNLDLIISRRKLLGFAVYSIVFGCDLSPLCKIKKDTLNNRYKIGFLRGREIK